MEVGAARRSQPPIDGFPIERAPANVMEMIAQQLAQLAQPTFASQIVEFTPGVAGGTFVMSLQVDPLNGGSFGLRLMENDGIAKLLAVDDATNTLNAYNFALQQ